MTGDVADVRSFFFIGHGSWGHFDRKIVVRKDANISLHVNHIDSKDFDLYRTAFPA